MTQDRAKESAGIKALEFVEEGMVIGLGTGSTAAFFIAHLIKKCKQGLRVKAVATSDASEKQARLGGIPLLDVNAVTSLDLVVDGADQIDRKKRLIKGAGGALTREKIIAAMGKEMIVIADESKQVDQLGRCLLPVEVIPFGLEAIRSQLAALGYQGKWRQGAEGSFYLTDNGNRILDIDLPSPLDNPEKSHSEIRAVPGVLETGFFFNLATRIVIGKSDGGAVVLT